jgi:hypothetical protein
LASTIDLYPVVSDVDQMDKEPFMQGVVTEYCSLLGTQELAVGENWGNADFQMRRRIEPAQVLEKSLDPSVVIVLGADDALLLRHHLHTGYLHRLIANAMCPIITIPTCLRR